ncbi:MAG: ABC transporter ATP-binding protein [Rhodobacterales bacterium]|jgi:branched-chain amino acid transport system ATP-binding protein
MILELTKVEAGYGAGQVLFGIDLKIDAGQCVSLMGRNGMGKSTTIRSIMGQLLPTSGVIKRFGVSSATTNSHEIAQSGIGLVPEGRQIFPNLSVQENLTTFYRPPRHNQDSSWTEQKVLKLFPRLSERLENLGSQLSGGEQQMLAIGRALMTNPRLLILDEATEGLAPIIRKQIWNCLYALKESGQSILVVDKNITALAKLSDHHYILDKGVVAWHGGSSELLKDPELKAKYLGI